jgi:hypothetical protein
MAPYLFHHVPQFCFCSIAAQAIADRDADAAVKMPRTLVFFYASHYHKLQRLLADPVGAAAIII